MPQSFNIATWKAQPYETARRLGIDRATVYRVLGKQVA
jgi:hypothetical protein